MSDHHDAPGLPSRDEPPSADDAAFDALLRAALEADDAELEADVDPETLPAGLRARALAAMDIVAAETLLADALEGASEALLVERRLLEPQRVGRDRRSPGLLSPGLLSPGLRRAALAAFDRPAATPATTLTLEALASREAPTGRPQARNRDEPLRATRLAPLLRLRGAAVAAAAVLLLAVGLVVTSDDREAHAGLQLRALARADTAGSVQTSRIEPRYFAALGQAFAPGRDELLRFSLAEDAMVVVGAGDAVRVSRAALARDGVRADDAVLRLESGEAQLATRGPAVPMLIDGVGLLVLSSGAAHVAVDAGDGSHAPAVALYEGSTARFHRADGSGSVPLVGPTRVLLEPQGVKAFGAPARALFHDLRFFGGPLPEATHRRVVSARLFRVAAVDDPARTVARVRRGRQALRVLAPAIDAGSMHADTPEPGATTHATTRLVWRPEPAVQDAHALEIALRAPIGTRVTIAQDGADDLVAMVAHAGVGREPGVATISLSLPTGWFDRLPAGRMDLQLDTPLPTASAATEVLAWFDGVALVFGPAPDGRKARRDD